ncbi:uncharacterized protein N7498_010554 [Penicillium cinerascens]|uniref:Uncharacterized protein n=1 Tax=Penicillium cinerascens TaxID=70096 RepID=A0A9W9J864_9EURO|nr:uncharacterized protein N7498_010554 [Penicillium cinerascens]KAJ5191569.1 hypothetical protein N7498_010554 [Penicillium cinerascens]
MAAVIAHVVRPSIRHFSAHRPRPDSRASRAVALSCLVSGVVLPFVPPALESSRQRKSGSPNSNKPNPLSLLPRTLDQIPAMCVDVILV